MKKLLISCLVLLLVLSTVVYAGGAREKGEQVVKVGFIGPLTGPNAYQGVGARNAFQLAIKMANDSGQYPYTIEGLIFDDASDPGTGAAAALRIINDENVVAAIGHWNSPVAEATIPVFKEAKIPFTIWGAISPTLTSTANYPYVTRVCLTSVQQNIPLAKFLVEENGYRRFAIVSDTTTYGVSNTQSWTKEIGNMPNAEIVATHEIHVGETDFRAVLTSIQRQNPDVVYFGGVVTEAALVRRQMDEIGMENVLLTGISGIADEKFIEVAGAGAAEGTITAKPGMSVGKMPQGPDFISKYQAGGFSEPYGVYGPYAYDAINLILAALKDVGPDSAKLVNAITGISYDGLLGTTTFDNIGQTQNILVSIQVAQDGKFVDWDDSKYFTGERKLPGK